MKMLQQTRAQGANFWKLRSVSLPQVSYGAAVLALMGHCNVAVAQTKDAASNGVGIESVVVTGSHIQGIEVPDTAPLQVIDRADIVATGAQQVSGLLNFVPSNTGTTMENEGGSLVGTAQFSLRGLGYSSTLTLVNGRRAGVAPLSDKSGDDFLDINQFPLAMIQRIDVLKDGSSAIYGSEAVAGVVNIVTRQGFDGVELSADGASATNKSYSLNLAAGKAFDKGSINFYATYYSQSANTRGDFDWLVQRVGGNGNPANGELINAGSYPGNFLAAFTDANGKPEALANAVRTPDPNCQAANGVFRNTNGVANTTQCLYNFENTVSPIPAESFLKTFFEARYKLIDGITYFNETNFANDVSKQHSDPSSFSNGATVGSQAGALYIPASSPFNFFIANPAVPGGLIYVPPSQWNNAVDHAVGLVAPTFRPQGIFYYPVTLSQTNQYLRTLNGFDIDLPANWKGSLSYMWAQGEYTQVNPGNINAAALNALTASGQYDPFALSVLQPTLVSPKDGISTAGNSSAVLHQIFYNEIDRRRTEQDVVDFSASGPLLDLPTGPVSAAVGGQYRHQTLSVNPDSLTEVGLAASPTPAPSFSGAEHVWSGYAEIVAAVTSRADIQAAVRYEDYGTGIGSSTSPKISGRFGLIPDVLNVRGSWGTAFQAPTLTQDATTVSEQFLTDPVTFTGGTPACGQASVSTAGTIVETTGGNLKPQKSTNYSFGFDASPLDGLKLSADYWHYRYTNLIAAGLSGQAIVNSECVNGQYVANPNVIRLATGVLSQVNSAFVNIGQVITDGVDLNATYATTIGSYGDLTFGLDTTYVDKFDVYGASGSVSHDVGSRNFSNNFAPMPAWRGTLTAGWVLDESAANIALHYVNGYRNDQSPAHNPIGSYTTIDVQFRYNLAKIIDQASAVTVGLNNVFDTPPPNPVDPSAVTGVDRPGYDPLGGADLLGRTVYVHLIHTF